MKAEEQAAAAHEAICRFVAASRYPVVLEPGDAPFPISQDSFEAALVNGRLTLQVWNRERSLLRRVTRVVGSKSGALELEIEHFGKRYGTLQLLDIAQPQTTKATKKGQKLEFRETFRRMVARQFAGWHLTELTTEADLQRSLSPSYPRAVLRKGNLVWTAIGAPADASDVDGVLTFGLIWLDYIVRREPDAQIRGLAIFVPQGKERTTCLRLTRLNGGLRRMAVYAYAKGYEEPADISDYGNLDTVLSRCQSSNLAREPEQLVRTLLDIDGVEAIPVPDGSVSLRVHGLEFARASAGEIVFGFDRRRVATKANGGELIRLAAALAAERHYDASARESIFRRAPELWLESSVRRDIAALDASLFPYPVYGQVPAFAGGDRGIIDLLAVDVNRRLSVIELKASEDVHLPLQALDYWLRVNWHLERDEFASKGYFAGEPIARTAPRLLLVAPALAFHPTTETILRYFSSEIEVERIGVTMDWRKELHVAFRLLGAESRS